MKFGIHLLTNLTPEWDSQYISYEKLKQIIEKWADEAPISVNGEENPLRTQHFLKADDEFFLVCQAEASKVNNFFNEKVAEANRRFANLQDEVQCRKNLYGSVANRNHRSGNGNRNNHSVVYPSTVNAVQRKGSQRPSIIPPLSRIIPERLLGSNGDAELQPMKLKSISSLKSAFSEFYLMLILLQKFQQLNFTGFRKILKKHDKKFETTRGEEWRKMHIETAPFWISTAVMDLIREVETIFTVDLEAGNRSRAMERLRVPPLEERQSPIVTFRLGVFIVHVILRTKGMTTILLPLLIICILTLNKSQMGKPLAWREALHLYRSSFLIILQLILSGLNVYGWSSSGVNHILIFGIDPRHHLTYQQLLEIGTCLCVFWVLSFIGFVIMSYLDFFAFLQPLIFLTLLLIFLINPFPILYRPARFWLLKILGRILSSAFHPIIFADFWITNQLATLELAFFDLEYFFCFYFSNPQWWSGDLTVPSSPQGALCTGWSRYVLQAFLLALPSSFRLIQCIRRYYDSKQKFPHLANAGKYSTSVLVAITNSLRRGTTAANIYRIHYNPFVYIWIATAAISSTYKLIWDFKMDWGFFDKNPGENKFLRSRLIYSSKLYYYYAIVQDVIFRYLWTINIFINFTSGTAEYSDIIGFGFGLMELLRRFLWNFFRVENEHLNNCGQFRAVRNISIAPITTGINFSLIHSKLNKEPGIRRRGAKGLSPIIPEENGTVTIDDINIKTSEAQNSESVEGSMPDDTSVNSNDMTSIA